MTPKPPDKPKSIYRRPNGSCHWCGSGINGSKLICEFCRRLDPAKAAMVEKDERR